jgi:hypothetical protein
MSIATAFTWALDLFKRLKKGARASAPLPSPTKKKGKKGTGKLYLTTVVA